MFAGLNPVGRKDRFSRNIYILPRCEKTGKDPRKQSLSVINLSCKELVSHSLLKSMSLIIIKKTLQFKAANFPGCETRKTLPVVMEIYFVMFIHTIQYNHINTVITHFSSYDCTF